MVCLQQPPWDDFCSRGWANINRWVVRLAERFKRFLRWTAIKRLTRCSFLWLLLPSWRR